jgi:hypothetical protein
LVALNVLILHPLGTGQTKSGTIFFIMIALFFFVFSSLLFSFPNPPRREEKNGASKRDGTEIQMKSG